MHTEEDTWIHIHRTQQQIDTRKHEMIPEQMHLIRADSPLQLPKQHAEIEKADRSPI